MPLFRPDQSLPSAVALAARRSRPVAFMSAGSPTTGFVLRDPVTGNLTLNGTRFRFSGPNCPGLGLTDANSAYGATVDAQGLHLPSHSEVDAILSEVVAMNGTVIRAWAAVASVGKISAVQPTLGVFSATALEPIDYLLQRCASLGIKLVLPLVDNYQYAINGKFWYCTANGVTPDGDATQFFSNSTIVNSFKAHITFVLNHVNIYTGVAYKDDPNVLCWETGNELNAASLASATMITWVANIASHIKTTLGARQLVMDGSYGLGDIPSAERMALTQVDIYSDHAYDQWRYPNYLDNEGAVCHAYGKAFVVGEFDWRNSGQPWQLPELLSVVSSSPNIDGDGFWALAAPLVVPDAFGLIWPGTNADKVIRGGELADHAAEMSTRTAFGPRVVHVAGGSTSGATTRSVLFYNAVYRPEVNDVVVIMGGNNATPVNGVVASTPAGWVNPLGSGVGVVSDTHTLAVFYHLVTPAEQEAATVGYSAVMYTANSWGDTAGFVVRGADPSNPVDAISTAFNSGNTTTPHVLPGLAGSGLSDDSLAVSCTVSNSYNTYTSPSTDWASLIVSNALQGLWFGVHNKLSNAGVSVSSANITPSTGDEYASITMAFNKAPAISQTAIAPGRNMTLAMGDSITDYGGNQDYQPWLGPIYLNQLHILSRQRIRYGGVYATGGYHMTQIRDTHLPQVLALSPAPGAAILFLGTNDIGNPLNYTQHIFKGIVAQLLDASIAPILVTIMPRDDATTNNPTVITWNTWVKQFALANGFFVLDAYAAVSLAGAFRSGYSSDGMHPTPIGYRAIADQGITDGLPLLFPVLTQNLTSTLITDLTNFFNDGVNNLGLFTTDTDLDGVADGFTKSGTGTFSLVIPSGGDGLSGNWQQIRHSTTGNTVFIQRTISGYVGGEQYRFSCRVQTSNISSTGRAFYLELKATVPGGYTYPNGSSGTSVQIGAEVWSADTDGLFMVEFIMPPGTTALVFTAAIDAMSAGQDPQLRIGELTMVRAQIIPSLYPPIKRPNRGALVQL